MVAGMKDPLVQIGLGLSALLVAMMIAWSGGLVETDNPRSHHPSPHPLWEHGGQTPPPEPHCLGWP